MPIYAGRRCSWVQPPRKKSGHILQLQQHTSGLLLVGGTCSFKVLLFSERKNEGSQKHVYPYSHDISYNVKYRKVKMSSSTLGTPLARKVSKEERGNDGKLESTCVKAR